MAETRRGQLADTSDETIAGEHLFLTRLCLGILAVAAIGWIYNLHSRHLVEAQVDAALAGDAGSVSAADARAAFEQMRSPHFFTNVFEADSPIPTEDPVLGDLSEEELIDATDPRHTASEWARVEAAGLDAETVRRTFAKPGGPTAEERKEWAAAFPKLYRTAQLKRTKFSTKNSRLPNKRSRRAMTRADQNFCRSYQPCLAPLVAHRAPRLARYLAFRRANAAQQALGEEEIPGAVRNMALWMRAFRLDKVDNDAPVVASDTHLLRKMLALRTSASDTGLLFSAHLTFIGLLIGLFRWVAPRFRPQPAP
jgi:hypothetical protein